MRIRGLFVALMMVMATTLSAQEPVAVDSPDEKIAKLEKDLADKGKQIETLMTQVVQLAKPKPTEDTPAEKKQKARAGFAAAFRQAREASEAGCKDAGGKKISSVTVNNDGKPSATCEF